MKKILTRIVHHSILVTTNKYLQGRVQVPTGGIAHEPQGMIRCDSEADSKVWMKEDRKTYFKNHCSGL